MGQSYGRDILSRGDRTGSDDTHPSRKDWITKHTQWTGLSIVEVERLWIRFQQLGCDKDGRLSIEALTNPKIADDIFVSNVLKRFLEDDVIKFQSFLNLMKWMDTKDQDTKMRGIFRFFNNGINLNKAILSRIVGRVYTKQSAVESEQIADLLIKKMDSNGTGEITEDQFVEWVNKLPEQTLEQLLEFHIVPPSISREGLRAESQPKGKASTSLPPSPASMRTLPGPSRYPTDNLLRSVADTVSASDWLLLVNKLGFLQSDIASYEKKYKKRSDQVFYMFLDWRKEMGSKASIDDLIDVLRQCNMDTVADELV